MPSRIINQTDQSNPTKYTTKHHSGAGSGLSPNGQICLHALGFPHAQVMAITTPIQEHILVEGDRVLARSDYPARLYAKYGIPLTGTLRGDLVDMLAGPLREARALKLGQPVTGVRQLADDRWVGLEDESIRVVNVDLLPFMPPHVILQ